MTKLDQQKDPRVIPLGRILRASALDELPQLFNVIKGDMSLIGPRPCIPYEYDRYTDDHKLRMLATPGMTGLWQVSGKNHTTFEEMVALDVDYAYRQSPALDLWILFRTPGVIFTQLLELMGKHTQKHSHTQGATENTGAQS
jgi:lipopolysaccharide/colanic/teichoic acid biosynthesis glycosyltransferase